MTGADPPGVTGSRLGIGPEDGPIPNPKREGPEVGVLVMASGTPASHDDI